VPAAEQVVESSTEQLSAACRSHRVPSELIPAVVHYLRAMQRWNRVHNLTSVTEPDAMVTRHILDSLAVRPWVLGPSVLDVGSGAGLPGLVLALADQHLGVPSPRPPLANPPLASPPLASPEMPCHRYCLLDSRLKRVRFLRQMVVELSLTQVDVVHSRVEDLQSEPGFATVLSRAFAAPAEFVAKAGHCLAPGGRLLAMLGVVGPNPISLPTGWACRQREPVVIPGLAAHRHIAVIEREIL